MRTPNQYIRDLGKRAKEQRGVFILYSILRLLVVLISSAGFSFCIQFCGCWWF